MQLTPLSLLPQLTCCDLDFTTRGPFPCPRGGSNVHLLGRFGAEDIYQLPDMSVYRPHSNGFGIAQGLTATNPLSEKTWLRTRSLHPGFSFSAADKRPTNDWSRTVKEAQLPKWVERMGQTTAERGLSPRIQQRKKAFPDKAAFPERYRTGTPLKAHASPSIGPGYRCQSPPKWPEPRGTYEGVPRSPRRKAFGSTRSEGFGMVTS